MSHLTFELGSLLGGFDCGVEEPVCLYGRAGGRAGGRPLHDALRWDVRCCRVLGQSVI
jgi:hypothetical protein